MTRFVVAAILAGFVCVGRSALYTAEGPVVHEFTLPKTADVTATIAASCERCDWSAPGREGAALMLQVDGKYLQHVLLTRDGQTEHSVLLGPLPAGPHTLAVARDSGLSAADIGRVAVARVDVRTIEPASPEHAWLAETPILLARPRTVELFNDVPLAMYVEALPSKRGYRYTVVFSHEDGGTPTDRLMATWGRSTDIEFVYESERMPDGTRRQEYQGPKHEILPFQGQRLGAHPLLWVATDNNMVSDRGPDQAYRFAFAPELVDLTDVSREAFMDAHPWLYAVMAAELVREARIDPAAPPGSGKIPDPLSFGYVEACGKLRDATLAFDVAVESGGQTKWHATDRGDARFRIARSGCFRAAVPLPAAVRASQITGLRARAYTRPPRQGEPPLPAGAGEAALSRVNTMFMLDGNFTPVPSGASWAGSIALPPDGAPVNIPVR
jgi:hypothetical protein